MFKNEWDSIVVLNATDLTSKTVMPNTTFVSYRPHCNARRRLYSVYAVREE